MDPTGEIMSARLYGHDAVGAAEQPSPTQRDGSGDEARCSGGARSRSGVTRCITRIARGCGLESARVTPDSLVVLPNAGRRTVEESMRRRGGAEGDSDGSERTRADPPAPAWRRLHDGLGPGAVELASAARGRGRRLGARSRLQTCSGARIPGCTRRGANAAYRWLESASTRVSTCCWSAVSAPAADSRQRWRSARATPATRCRARSGSCRRSAT